MFGYFGFVWEILSRWVVPFFFITSAYFLYLKNGANDFSALKKYISRIALLYLVWFIYNIPSVIYQRIILTKSYSFIKLLLVLKSFILSSTFTGSWFLVSCIFCSVLLYLLKKVFSTKMILIVSVFIQILCVVSSLYGQLLLDPIKSILNFLLFPLNVFGGLFYFAVGLYFAENKLKYKIINMNRHILLFVLLLVLYFLEIFFSKKWDYYYTSDQSFFIAPLSILVFVFAINSRIKVSKAKSLRKISTIVYCAQGNILLVPGGLEKICLIDSKLILTIAPICLMLFIVWLVLLLQRKNVKYSNYLT